MAVGTREQGTRESRRKLIDTDIKNTKDFIVSAGEFENDQHEDKLKQHTDFIEGRITTIFPKGNSARFSKSMKEKLAKDGFMGTVSMKTLFTVGEGNKKEHVTRKKSNNIFDVGGF